MAAKSSDFYRLEKVIKTNYGSYIDVYEFHKVVNGTMYVQRHEEGKGYDGYHYKLHTCTAAQGNKKYSELKAQGYEFAGQWEMDILGYKTRVS